MVLVENMFRITFDKWGHVTFPGTSYNICNFLVEMLKFKQSITLRFGRNKFGKKAVQN